LDRHDPGVHPQHLYGLPTILLLIWAIRAFAVDDHASDHRPFVTDIKLMDQ
jgi:hypothetical protein